MPLSYAHYANMKISETFKQNIYPFLCKIKCILPCSALTIVCCMRPLTLITLLTHSASFSRILPSVLTGAACTSTIPSCSCSNRHNIRTTLRPPVPPSSAAAPAAGSSGSGLAVLLVGGGCELKTRDADQSDSSNLVST